jgi:Fumarylacetoacetase N-terminal
VSEYVVDLGEIERLGLMCSTKGDTPSLFSVLRDQGISVFDKEVLNEFIDIGKKYWKEARDSI